MPACPHCGLTGGGQYCTNCGTELPGAGPRARQTSHFRLHTIPHSFAEQNRELIGARLERAYTNMSALLGIEVQRAVIEVHLSELFFEYEGHRLAGGGYALPARLQIHDVYVPDAPGEDLERSLLILLLTLALDQDSEPPALIVDGLLSRAMQSPDVMREATSTVLEEARERGELPSLMDSLNGPAHGRATLYQAVGDSFVGFLIDIHGIERLKAFCRELKSRQDVNAAAQEAFGEDLSRLEKKWLQETTPAPAVGVWRLIGQATGYLAPYRRQVAEIVLYIALAVGFTIGMAKMQGLLIDKALVPKDRHALAVIMGILIGTFLITSLTSLRQNYLAAFVAESVLRDLRLRMFAHIQNLHPGYLQRKRSGDLISRMTNDVSAIQFAITGSLAQGLRLGLTFLAAMVTIFLTDWRLAAVGVLGLPVFFFSTYYLGPVARRASKQRQRQLGNATSKLHENLGAQPVVKAFGLEQRMIDDYAGQLGNLFQASLQLSFLSSIYGLSAISVSTAISLAVMGVGALLVIGDNLTIGTLFTFLALMAQVIGPVQGLSGILQGLRQASGAMDRVEELLAVEPAIQDAPQARLIGSVRHGIRLERVSFAYEGSQPVLCDLDLEIEAGTMVALVGPSGCGKSTTLGLIMRFFDPDSGRVLLDGVDIRSATLQSVRGQMGVVFQDCVLFDTSIRENIRVGNLRATDAEVEAAARSAEIHEMIVSLPDGYDTVVGERGSRVSGGQRQRLALARAMVRNPAILLLDEATSALDPRTESAIMATLRRVSHGLTTIAVTHRLASVAHADHIFVLDRGQLVEQGAHDDLVKLDGLYALLWREQENSVNRGLAPSQGLDISQLRDVPLFAPLDVGLRAMVAQRLTLERFAAGEDIIRHGDMGDKFYVMHRGQVNVLSAGPATREQPLAVLREGDYFGEMALLRDAPRNATVRARTDVEVYSLSKPDFDGLLVGVPVIRRQLEEGMAARSPGPPVRPAS